MLEKTRLHLCSLLFCAFTLPALAHAQESVVLEAQDKYIYEKPSFAKMSQLFWALSKFDVNDDAVVDDFMRINECEIYANFINDEFEWKEIRESSRQYIKSNVGEFSTRFEIEQPLRLSEYDFEQNIFEVWEPYKIDGIRLFEVLSPEFAQNVCGVAASREVPGYPRALFVELPRPVSVLSFKMRPAIAKAFVQMKSINSNKLDKNTLYESRDAYLVMKLKFYSVKEDVRDRTDGRLRTKALAALESLEVYADRKRKFLLYSKVFRQRTGKANAEDAMKKRFEKRKAERAAKKAAEKAEEEAKAAAEEAAAAQ